MRQAGEVWREVRECVAYEESEPWSEWRVREGERLLEAVLREFPTGSAVAAEWARWRTGWRFQPGLSAAAERVGRPWRDVMLANVSYDHTLYETSCGRHDALMARLSALGPGGRPTDAELLSSLRDSQVLQDITVQHVIARPSAGIARAWVPAA